MLAIPEGETRKIDGIQTFVLTSVFSVLAYLWVCVIVLWATPNIVEVCRLAMPPELLSLPQPPLSLPIASGYPPKPPPAYPHLHCDQLRFRSRWRGENAG